MKEGFDPDVVAEYERNTWSRCAEDYVDTFAGITGEAVPLLMEAAAIRSESHVLEIGSGNSGDSLPNLAQGWRSGLDYEAGSFEAWCSVSRKEDGDPGRVRLAHRDTKEHFYATTFAISDSQATSVTGNDFIAQWQTDAGAALFCRVKRQYGLG